MASKSYTSEDEEFVRFVRTTHTLKETAEISGLSESIIKRIIYTKSPDKLLELEKSLSEQKSLIDAQAKAIDKLNKSVFKRNEYEDEQPVRKLVLGRKINE